jgi:hypothetical protein
VRNFLFPICFDHHPFLGLTDRAPISGESTFDIEITRSETPIYYTQMRSQTPLKPPLSFSSFTAAAAFQDLRLLLALTREKGMKKEMMSPGRAKGRKGEGTELFGPRRRR